MSHARAFSSQLPIVRSLKYLMMLTDEAFVIDPIATDLFAEMAARGALVASLQAVEAKVIIVITQPRVQRAFFSYICMPRSETRTLD